LKIPLFSMPSRYDPVIGMFHLWFHCFGIFVPLCKGNFAKNCKQQVKTVILCWL
jgi:hypothetical protein